MLCVCGGGGWVGVGGWGVGGLKEPRPYEVRNMKPGLLLVATVGEARVSYCVPAFRIWRAGAVRAAVLRGGNVLIPVYALGRAQELLLVLGVFALLLRLCLCAAVVLCAWPLHSIAEPVVL
jgi:hypothetical protein